MTGACGPPAPSVDDGGGDQPEVPAADDTGDSSGEDTDEDLVEEAPDKSESESEVVAPESTEERFDPLPIPADLDQVGDVFVSLLGPTDDFVKQVHRVAPDHPQLPTPPGAEIVLLRISFRGGSGSLDAEQQHNTTRVVMTSTMAPAELAVSMDQAILAAHPDWEVDPPSQSDVVAAQLLKYDLPDVEQAGGEQNLTPDLKVAIDPIEGGGSEVAISRSNPTPLAPPSGAYTEWEDQIPVVDEAVHSGGSIEIEKGPTLKLSAIHRLATIGLTEYRDDYLAFLIEQGLTVESETPNQERIELSVGGHPQFDTLIVRVCCTGDRYRGATTFTTLATVEL